MHHATRSPLAALLISLACFLPSCGQMIWTSGAHGVVAPDQIQILVHKPPRYERLGTVTHLYAEGTTWEEGGDGTTILLDLLTEVGAMGANTLLLADDTTMADSSITMKYQGTTYTLAVIAKSKTVVAQAIFVPK